MIAPLMRIEILSYADLSKGPWAAFLITSVQCPVGSRQSDPSRGGAARAGFHGRGANARRKSGGANLLSVTSADGNVDDLVDLVAARLTPPARLLYLGGEDRSGDLAGELRAKGFEVDTVVVYRSVVAEKMPQPALDALANGIDAVLHYSRRSAEAYIEAARRSGVLTKALEPLHLCLSAQIAEPLHRRRRGVHQSCLTA